MASPDITVKIGVDDSALRDYLAKADTAHQLRALIAEEVHRQVVEEVKKQIDGLFRSIQMRSGYRNYPEGA